MGISTKKKIAFICVHNSCRSQIAEALGKYFEGDRFDFYSAGTETKPQINQDAVRLMKQLYGIDMEDSQYSKTYDKIPSPDIAISMGCDVGCPFIGRDFDENWGLPDPTGKNDEEFIEVIEQIAGRIQEIAARVSTQEKLNVLSKLAAEFNKENLVWAVGASLMLYFKGYVDSFNDLDLMVSAEDAEKMEAILSSFGSLQPSTKANFETKHFRKFMVDGVEVDMIGGFAIVSGGRVHDCDLKPKQIAEHVTVNGQEIPLHSVALWRTYYALMGRDSKVKIIDEQQRI